MFSPIFKHANFNLETEKSLEFLFDNLKSHPLYSDSYTFELGKSIIFQLGELSIKLIDKSDNIDQCFVFFPSREGKVESISIYGNDLKVHFDSVKSNSNIFGFPVEDIEIVTENTLENFVDITVGAY